MITASSVHGFLWTCIFFSSKDKAMRGELHFSFREQKNQGWLLQPDVTNLSTVSAKTVALGHSSLQAQEWDRKLSAKRSVLRSFLGISLRPFIMACLRSRGVLVCGPTWETQSFTWRKYCIDKAVDQTCLGLCVCGYVFSWHIAAEVCWPLDLGLGGPGTGYSSAVP